MGLDSIELVMDVEKHFSIAIPDREAEKAYTVGKLVNCVAKILEVTNYDFSLRDKTFSLIRTELSKLNQVSENISLNNKVMDDLDIQDKLIISELEIRIDLKLPGIIFKPENKQGVFGKVKHFFTISDQVDFELITWKKFIDITLAKNLSKVILPTEYKSKYEIYLAIMKITVDKIGVDYAEMGLEKSFTDDLGVD